MDELFKEGKETQIGTINIDSGTLLITDGIFDSSNINSSSKQKVEFGSENVRLKVVGTSQNGKRFLIIPLDNVEEIMQDVKSEVEVTGAPPEEESKPESEPEPEPPKTNEE